MATKAGDTGADPDDLTRLPDRMLAQVAVSQLFLLEGATTAIEMTLPFQTAHWWTGAAALSQPQLALRVVQRAITGRSQPKGCRSGCQQASHASRGLFRRLVRCLCLGGLTA